LDLEPSEGNTGAPKTTYWSFLSKARPAHALLRLLSENMRMFNSPCPYVYLSDYDWKLVPDYLNPPECPTIKWNATVYSLLAAFEGCTVCIAVYIHIQLFYTFTGKKSLYFW
jgi:hypothetical protein